ncbi:saccharopine dehydrogenase C-terminal domain-containing protein [Lutibacter sp. TH_r2]|uniref:saccharopine dehydrogenase family protein n=1 Tax=Lutibacter sp. TH_r2 TaxID=3082083 RepID=UPI0029556C57|nr:saccharopine dehydrogenase C-terminal domain-containing protein [Lutibacter sp. TH_r2]MDV7187713.1 saccharopine dehydrogenase C-terminal domain-containing protein [Lutibacter sp. TH_r2]
MQHILIIGAGKSASSLISYLLKKSETENFCVTIGDLSLETIQIILNNHLNGKAILLNIFDENQLISAIENADVVISMLPARFHMLVAIKCLNLNKHLVTASYVSNEMKALHKKVKAKGLVFMNEIGLDPGIDHMSAMKIIDEIRDSGGKMLLFESFCGGLVAPESDDNLWNYKFTWNPRNVVLAGQGGTAKFIQEGKYKYIPYHKLFRRTEIFKIDEYGKFEAYPNRDSLKYIKEYGLEDVLTLYRGTIRRVGFSKAWNVFVQLGMTDDSYTVDDSETMSYRDFTNSFLAYNPNDSVELKLRHYLKIDQDDIIWEKLLELDIFNPTKVVGLKNATPAQILQKILQDKWTLKKEDKDMIVMQHLFGFEKDGKKQQIKSSMVCVGDDQTYTAMAKTVGLPVGIAALKILKGEINSPGVQIPTKKDIYEPILEELTKNGIIFKEKYVQYFGYNPEQIHG